MNALKMTLCGVVEVRNLADAVGLSCSNLAIEHCSDCGIEPKRESVRQLAPSVLVVPT